MDIKEEIKKIIVEYLRARKNIKSKDKTEKVASLRYVQELLSGNPNFKPNPVEGLLEILKKKYGELGEESLVECMNDLISEGKVKMILTRLVGRGANPVLMPEINE